MPLSYLIPGVSCRTARRRGCSWRARHAPFASRSPRFYRSSCRSSVIKFQ